MNNTVKYVLQHILHNVPEAILREAFIPKDVKVPNTIDFYINDKIIAGRCLDACNLYSGKKKRILLKTEYLEKVAVPDHYSVLNAAAVGVYRIPPEHREHRDISHVLELLYPYSATGFTNINYPSMIHSGNTVGDTASDVIKSHTNEDVYARPRPILLAGDLIKLEPPQLSHIDWMMEVLLKFDEDFTNMNQSAIAELSKLALSATKAYVYNELILKINEVFLVGGQEQTTFRDIVQSYEGENERFDELVKDVRGAMSADPELLSDMLSHMF